MAVNWIAWLMAAAGGCIVGALVYSAGVWMDKRREDRRLSEEVCAMQAEMESKDDDSGA